MADIPKPPFTEENPWTGGVHGHVACFFDGCTRQYNDYFGLARHIQSRIKPGHNVSMVEFKGTYFYNQHALIRNAQEKTRFAARKLKMARNKSMTPKRSSKKSITPNRKKIKKSPRDKKQRKERRRRDGSRSEELYLSDDSKPPKVKKEKKKRDRRSEDSTRRSEKLGGLRDWSGRSKRKRATASRDESRDDSREMPSTVALPAPSTVVPTAATHRTEREAISMLPGATALAKFKWGGPHLFYVKMGMDNKPLLPLQIKDYHNKVVEPIVIRDEPLRTREEPLRIREEPLRIRDVPHLWQADDDEATTTASSSNLSRFNDICPGNLKNTNNASSRYFGKSKKNQDRSNTIGPLHSILLLIWYFFQPQPRTAS